MQFANTKNQSDDPASNRNGFIYKLKRNCIKFINHAYIPIAMLAILAVILAMLKKSLFFESASLLCQPD